METLWPDRLKIPTPRRNDLDSLSARPVPTFAGHGNDRQSATGVQRLTGLSYAHPAVAAVSRASLSFADGSLEHALARAVDHDVFVLSTCLRVEIVWAGGPEEASGVMTGLYGEQTILPQGTVRVDEEEFLHLCRIAAGLDSPLVGEMEVLTQFRQAARRFGEVAAGSGLGKMLDAAIGVGRVARRHLGDSIHGSLASEAARRVSSLERVAILGGGAMARAAVRHLDGAEVSVFTRRPGLVAGRQSHPWDGVPEAMATFPAVISTVPGGGQPFADGAYLRALERRRDPLLFVDLGMPPALTPLPTMGWLRYLGVDEVAASVEVAPAGKAEDVAAGEALAAWARLTAPERVGSVIAAIVGQAEQAVDEEVRRFARRLAGARDPEKVLRQLAHTVARRILHPPISYVGSTPLGAAELDVISDAFGLDDE